VDGKSKFYSEDLDELRFFIDEIVIFSEEFFVRRSTAEHRPESLFVSTTSIKASQLIQFLGAEGVYVKTLGKRFKRSISSPSKFELFRDF
jgi:hypothetical protein